MTRRTLSRKLAQAQAVLEFGCGTGRLAARMLSEQLPADCVT